MNKEQIQDYTSKITVNAVSNRKGIRRVLEYCDRVDKAIGEVGDVFRTSDTAALFQKLGEIIGINKIIRKECELAELDNVDIISACYDMEQQAKYEEEEE